jgi:hypothetical protein
MKKFFFLSLTGLWVLAACDKQKTENTAESSQNDTFVGLESLLSVDEVMFDEAFLNDSPESFPPAPCASITRDTISIPNTITINYGTANCLCIDGRFRRGVVVISYLGQRRLAGSSYSVAFTNYHVNDHAVLGSINGSFALNGSNPLITRNSNITVISLSGDTSTRSANRSIEMIAGNNTPQNRLDDVYLISGNSSISRNGLSRTQNILSPLRREGNCNWIVSGTLNMAVGNSMPRTIDFGNGSCDNQATVTVNGQSRTITLP